MDFKGRLGPLLLGGPNKLISFKMNLSFSVKYQLIPSINYITLCTCWTHCLGASLKIFLL